MVKKQFTKTKGLKKWIIDNGYTIEKIQKEWDSAINANVGGLVGWLHKEGYDWQYLQTHQIPSLIGLADKTIAQRKKDEDEAIRKEMEEEKEDYKKNHYDEYVLHKIDNGEQLTEKELEKMLWSFKEIDTSYGENRRWNRSVRTILEIGGRYFALDWDEGLTECQENEFFNQPVEVKKREYTKTIVVTEWDEIKKGL